MIELMQACKMRYMHNNDIYRQLIIDQFGDYSKKLGQILKYMTL